MANNYPDTIPADYTAPHLEDAYRRGWNHGHGFACHNVPTLGDKLFVEAMGRVTVDAENIREVHTSLCFAAESHSRDYSPFDAGLSDAIMADLAGYTDEDYGIETEKETDD